MDGSALPVEMKARPVIGEQPRGHAPVLGCLGVPGRLHRVPMLPANHPAAARCSVVTPRGTAQLQPQQVGEQLVVAEPRPRRIQRDHERVGLLQVLQGSLAAAAAGQQLG